MKVAGALVALLLGDPRDSRMKAARVSRAVVEHHLLHKSSVSADKVGLFLRFSAAVLSPAPLLRKRGAAGGGTAPRKRWWGATDDYKNVENPGRKWLCFCNLPERHSFLKTPGGACATFPTRRRRQQFWPCKIGNPLFSSTWWLRLVIFAFAHDAPNDYGAHLAPLKS
jgi:hypothetical protein